MGIEGRAGSHSLRPLTKDERERCMQRVAEELAFAPEGDEGEPVPALQIGRAHV